MGLLDEAIREHLELKRAHGAGEDEVRRKEQEALGPARREAAPAQEPEAEAAAPAEAAPQPEAAPVEAEAAQPAEPVEPEPAVEEVAAPDASSLAPEPEVAAPAPAEPDSSEWAAIDEPFADPPPAPEPEPEPEAPAAAEERPSSGNTPTQGFDALADEGEGAEDAGAAEDVLEETPEFLQDTPEHDKLWFEQKPPRDFDFDDK
jgi:hypothetical protein